MNNSQESVNHFQNNKITGFVELGFRTPSMLDYFAKTHDAKTWGYDVVPLNIEVSKKLGYDGRHYDLNDCQEELDLSGANLVSAYHVIEHVSDPLQAVKKIYESMDSGSTFHVEIPIEPGEPRIEYGHLFPFEVGDLNAMLQEAGFRVVSLTTNTHTGGPQIERCIAKKD